MLSGFSSSARSAISSVNRTLPTAPVQPVKPVAARPTPTEMPGASVGQSATVVSISDEARQMAAEAFQTPGSGNDSSGDAVGEESFLGNLVAEEMRGAARGQDTEGTDDLSVDGDVGEARTETESNDPNELTEEEEQVVEDLRARDAEVRAHEQAHKAVGGQYAGAIHYDFQRGPDGQNYAVGGHVNIDISEVPNDPEATVVKMQQVVRAALAPAEPSSQDRAVAANANAKAAEARREAAEAGAEEMAARTTDQSTSGPGASEATDTPGVPDGNEPIQPSSGLNPEAATAAGLIRDAMGFADQANATETRSGPVNLVA